jgi:hypothetical protein
MQQTLCLVSQRKPGIHLASIGKPTLSIWQSAVLAYASAKCGTTFTSIDQTENWLRKNSQNPQRLTVKALCGLLLVEPPRGVRIFPPAPRPPTAA